MAVVRKNLDLCIGCRSCETVCPMDVMYFDEEENKSVIAYVQQCITCGQCWLRCPSGSLGLETEVRDFAINAGR